MDVDVIVEGRGALRVVEKPLTMVLEPIGRGYLPREETLSLKSIDIVSTLYDRGAAPVKILVDGYYVYVEPPEELVVRYLAGWKFRGVERGPGQGPLGLHGMARPPGPGVPVEAGKGGGSRRQA